MFIMIKIGVPAVMAVCLSCCSGHTAGGGNELKCRVMEVEGGYGYVDAYPVSVHAWDVVLVFITVLTVGFLSVWYPVRYLSKRLL